MEALAAQMPIRRLPAEQTTLHQIVTTLEAQGTDSLPCTRMNEAAAAILAHATAVIGTINPAQGGLTRPLAVGGKVDTLPLVALPHDSAILIPLPTEEVTSEAFGE